MSEGQVLIDLAGSILLGCAHLHVDVLSTAAEGGSLVLTGSLHEILHSLRSVIGIELKHYLAQFLSILREVHGHLWVSRAAVLVEGGELTPSEELQGIHFINY